jgi:hypothetical protein
MTERGVTEAVSGASGTLGGEAVLPRLARAR